MLDFYTWATPNGRKVSILLEELGVDYNVHPIDISKDAQFAPAFLEIAPNNKIPALVDPETGVKLMESGAILIYLAEKFDRFIGQGADRYDVVQWLMWQMGGFGPMLGQAHQYLHYNPGAAPFAEERFAKEVKRLYRVLNERLEGRDFVAGKGRGFYSIADMAIWPWVARHEWQRVALSDYPEVLRWYLSLAERPQVQRGYDIPHATAPIPLLAENS